jgi:hypothetical protein
VKLRQPVGRGDIGSRMQFLVVHAEDLSRAALSAQGCTALGTTGSVPP